MEVEVRDNKNRVANDEVTVNYKMNNWWDYRDGKELTIYS
jgi:hypothetical protein